MATYAHRPVATGLHAKLVREARERTRYAIEPVYGTPNLIAVSDGLITDRMGQTVWVGHRDLLPQQYRFASDPSGALTRPASD